MIVTIISTIFIISLIIGTFILNFAVSLFNKILYKILGLLIPISLISIGVQYLIYMFRTNILNINNVFDNIIFGTVTIGYLRKILKNNGILTNIIAIIIFIPMILYLYLDIIEYVFNFSAMSYIKQHIFLLIQRAYSNIFQYTVFLLGL